MDNIGKMIFQAYDPMRASLLVFNKPFKIIPHHFKTNQLPVFINNRNMIAQSFCSKHPVEVENKIAFACSYGFVEMFQRFRVNWTKL